MRLYALGQLSLYLLENKDEDKDKIIGVHCHKQTLIKLSATPL